MRNLDKFILLYTSNLINCVQEYPTEYVYPVQDVPKVVERMRKAIECGTYNHDSHAFKRTCKELGIKHTRKAITAYLKGE